MDLSSFSQYMVPVIMGICLCAGYVLKNLLQKFNHHYIPLVVGLLGVALAVWMYWPDITPKVVLIGLVSGLSSTGLHEVVVQLKTRRK